MLGGGTPADFMTKEVAYVSLNNRSVLTNRGEDRLLPMSAKQKSDMLSMMPLPKLPIASLADLQYAWSMVAEKEQLQLSNTAGVSRQEADKELAKRTRVQELKAKRRVIGKAPKTARGRNNPKSAEFVASEDDESFGDDSMITDPAPMGKRGKPVIQCRSKSHVVDNETPPFPQSPTSQKLQAQGLVG